MLHFTLDTTGNKKTACVELDTLLQGVAMKDASSLEQLYKATHASVFSFALSILKNVHDAEDVLHDCYIAVWNNAEGYCTEGKPLAWLMTVTKNLCFQLLRRRRKNADEPIEDHTAWSCSEEQSIVDRTVLSVCMEELTNTERQIVTLHAVSGFKHREVASLLDLPLATVLSKYHRAIKKLKQHLQ